MKPSLFFRSLLLMLCLCLVGGGMMGCVKPADPTDPTPDDPTPNDPIDPTPPEESGEIDDPAEPDEPTPVEPEIVYTKADSQAAVTDYLTLHGRTYMQNGALMLFWTNSGFSLRFEGTGLSAELTTSNTNPDYHGYLNVYIDGTLAPETVRITQNGRYVLAEGLEDGVHTIEIRKKNEAIYCGSATLGVQSLHVADGSFIVEAPAKGELKIEFVGASITSGFGNMVTDGSGANFTTPTEDGSATYAAIAARALHADYSMISRSGICYVRGTDRPSIFPHYTQTAALPNNLNCTDLWDFEANPTDVVVINLGTNDSGAKLNGASLTNEFMTSEAVDFLRMIRSNNPNAVIIWAYGLIVNERCATIEAAIKMLNEEGDHDIYYLPLTPQNTAINGVGVHNHPTVQTHILAAVTLVECISELTGTPIDGKVLLEAQMRCIDEYKPTADAALYEVTSYAAYAEARDTSLALLGEEEADYEACLMMMDALRTTRRALLEPDDGSSEYPAPSSLDLSLYDELDLGWTPYTYWHSSVGNNNHNRLISNPSFYGTRQFTREELPVGSVIVLAEGWKYRPDGWINDARTDDSQRPAESTESMLTITEDWWGNFTHRAFNLYRLDKSSLAEEKQSLVCSALKVYVPKEVEETDPSALSPAVDPALFDELDLGWTPSAYWHSSVGNNNHNRLISNPSFYGTRQFTREELPVGSVIVLAEGWKYRPDGWINDARTDDSQRPAESTESMLTITEDWWGNFTHRAFNLYRLDKSSLAEEKQSLVCSALKVYVPKK